LSFFANHGNERMSQGMVAQFGMNSLGAELGENPNKIKALFQTADGMGTQVGMLKFSRSNEPEADHIGLILMSMAGYDSNEAVAFWERMDAMSGGNAPMGVIRHHPTSDTRVGNLKVLMPEALKYY
tara:strand:+ start:172 stop:549 length:378 start_codon:yes stop_codon:yes gene_type:complete